MPTMCHLQFDDEARTRVSCKICREAFPVTPEEIVAYKYDLNAFGRLCPGWGELVAPEPKRLPPLYRRAYNFLRAWAAHAWQGNPRLSKRKVEKRLAICKACPSNLYHVGYCLHSTCGCPVNDRNTFFSKLYWRDGKCPMGHW